MKDSANLVLTDTWQFLKTDKFWNELAAYSQVFNFYDDDSTLIELLAGFVGTGINAGDCSVVICSEKHIQDLNYKLSLHGLHVDTLIADGRYLPIDAEHQLSELMTGNLPDQILFQKTISKLLSHPKRRERRMRMYREMSAILRMKGNLEADALLEQYWRQFRENEKITMFCGYPKYFFEQKDCGAVHQFYGNIPANVKIVDVAVNALEISYKVCNPSGKL